MKCDGQALVVSAIFRWPFKGSTWLTRKVHCFHKVGDGLERHVLSCVMSFLNSFFQIRCGWLPFAQMLQDMLQAGDIGPNILGLISGHTYFYFSEVRARMLLPDAPQLSELGDLLLRGKSIITIPQVMQRPGAARDSSADATRRLRGGVKGKQCSQVARRN